MNITTSVSAVKYEYTVLLGGGLNILITRDINNSAGAVAGRCYAGLSRFVVVS